MDLRCDIVARSDRSPADNVSPVRSSEVDSIDDFGKANALVDTASFKPIFAEVIDERRKTAGEIETCIRELGATPEDERTMLASATPPLN